MTLLLEMKEFITEYYKRFEKIINPLGKFVFCLVVLLRLNSFLGFNPMFGKFIVNLGLAVLGTFIPGSWFVLILMGIIAGQFMSSSIEAALLLTVAMLVVYLLFARIFPKMANFIILVPLCFGLKLGYVIPLAAGLFFGPSTIVAIATGVMVYRFADYLPGLMDVKSESLYDMPQTIMGMYDYLMTSISGDRTMMLMVAIFAIVIVITHMMSRLEHDFVWYMAIGAGAIVNILGFILGTLVLGADVSIMGVLLGTIMAAILVSLAQFLRFSLDYARPERTQFEDEDYYYFVKAIPKIKIAKAEKAIRKIR